MGNINVAPNENYIPTGLPGGFFIYRADENEEILFAEENVIKLFGCDTIADLREFTHNSFSGMVHPDDLSKIQNDIQAQTLAEVGLACDHARIACNTVKNRYDMIYSIYDSQLYEKLRKQQYAIDYVDDAVDKEYIKVFYQPVIRVKTGEICGYEALARWIDPKVGFLSPADFIETLEKFRLIHKIDTFIIKKVCEDYCELRDRGEPLVPVSINLSRLDFELCDIVEVVEHYTRLYNIPRDMLDLEVTESALNNKSDRLKYDCKKFRDLGYQIWIDDFGSGYSSLNTLMEYDFDVLKLDMEFLRTYDKNAKTGHLINYIVYAAEEMGVHTLTEGVEHEEHFEFLKEIGCGKAQGYYFSKPMAMKESREFTSEKGLVWETVTDR